MLKVGMHTIGGVKKKFIEEGFDAVLERCPTTRVYENKAVGDIEAKLVVLCCSEPPKGFAKGSLRLLVIITGLVMSFKGPFYPNPSPPTCIVSHDPIVR